MPTPPLAAVSPAKNEHKMVKIKGYIEKTAAFEKKKNLLSVDN